MKFKDLAWGSFIWVVLNKGTHYYDAYEKLINDKSFLQRLPQLPSSEDFQRLRKFLVNFGVHFAPTDLSQQYLSVWPQLKSHVTLLANEKLATCNFSNDKIQESINKAYNSLQYPKVWGGDTVASKVLHFFNVHLFIMWDNDIRYFYEKQFGVQDYVGFLKVMQSYLMEVIDDFHKLSLPERPEEFLSRQLGYQGIRPLIKFLDDWNWVIITKKRPPTIPDWLQSVMMK